MESQRVRLLLHGYLNLRWLDFKYPQTYSHLREELILNEVHRKLASEIFFLRTIKEASIGAGLIQLDPKYHTMPDDSYKGYVRSLLPSILEGSTIKVMTKADQQNMAALLKRKQAELDATKKK